MTWLVEVNSGDYQRVTGTLRIESGTLIFYDVPGRIASAYAPGTWLTVTLDEP